MSRAASIASAGLYWIIAPLYKVRLGHQCRFAASSSQLAEELQLTSLEIGFLPDRRQALQNLVNRTDMPAVRGLSIRRASRPTPRQAPSSTMNGNATGTLR